MLDFFYTLGQAACALLLVYGGYLVLMPARRVCAPDDEPVLLRQLQNDA